MLKHATLPLDLSFDQLKLRCYLTDNVSERGFVFMPWRFDQIEREVMLNSLPADGVFIDIGANVGIYSAIAATVLNQSGVVIALEPNPPVFDRLQFNLSATKTALSAPPRIELLPLGVSDELGEFDLYLDAENLGASSLIEKPTAEQSVAVECQPLLTIIKNQKLARVDVIKCDIEGAEDRALGPFLLEAPTQLLPDCVIFENNKDQWQTDLLEILRQRGYQQTHQTRLNLIYRRRQPIKLATKSKKFNGAIPAATSLQCKEQATEK